MRNRTTQREKELTLAYADFIDRINRWNCELSDEHFPLFAREISIPIGATEPADVIEAVE